MKQESAYLVLDLRWSCHWTDPKPRLKSGINIMIMHWKFSIPSYRRRILWASSYITGLTLQCENVPYLHRFAQPNYFHNLKRWFCFNSWFHPGLLICSTASVWVWVLKWINALAVLLCACSCLRRRKPLSNAECFPLNYCAILPVPCLSVIGTQLVNSQNRSHWAGWSSDLTKHKILQMVHTWSNTDWTSWTLTALKYTLLMQHVCWIDSKYHRKKSRGFHWAWHQLKKINAMQYFSLVIQKQNSFIDARGKYKSSSSAILRCQCDLSRVTLHRMAL